MTFRDFHKDLQPTVLFLPTVLSFAVSARRDPFPGQTVAESHHTPICRAEKRTLPPGKKHRKVTLARMKARLERKALTGSTNTRAHQLRQPVIDADGALILNGTSIVTAPQSGRKNSATGDCHPGTLDRHNGVYVLKIPRHHVRNATPREEGDKEQTQHVASPQPKSGSPTAWLQNSANRIPRGGGLGPQLGSGTFETQGSQNSCRGAKAAVPLSKAGLHSSLKSFNDSMKRGHVDAGEFLERAFVPAHPNSHFGARIPTEYESFQGSMDRWAAGPGGGVEGMRGHASGSWRDVHKPESRPFPAPQRPKINDSLAVLPQSITKAEVSNQLLACGAQRRRPLTARDRLPVPTGNTPRRRTPLRPQTARDRISSKDDPPEGGEQGEKRIQTSRGGGSKEPSDWKHSLSARSSTYSRRALQVMNQAQAERLGAGNIDIRGEKAVMAERDSRSKAARWEKNENEGATFQEEKDQNSRNAASSPSLGPRPSNDSPCERLSERQTRPHTARPKISLDVATAIAAKEADDTLDVATEKAAAKHRFLTEIDDDIAAFRMKGRRPVTASTAERIKNNMHAAMEVRSRQVRKTFRLMDQDHDGVINASDMAAGLEIINVPATSQEIQELLSAHRHTGRGGERGMTYEEYSRDFKRLRFPSQNPFEGNEPKIPFWKPKEHYARKWDGEYGKGPEGGGERIRTKLKWRFKIQPHADKGDHTARKPAPPCGFVHEENWPMMSKFIPLGNKIATRKPPLARGERSQHRSAWAERFSRKAAIAVQQHDLFLHKKRIYEQAKESEYLLEKPLFAAPEGERE